MTDAGLKVRIIWSVAAVIGVLYACSPATESEVTPTEVAAPVVAASFAPPPAAAAQPIDLSGGAAPGFVVTTLLAPDRGIDPGDYAWNADGVSDGPLKIVVDIAAQRLYAYRGGIEIGRSSINWGSDEKPTPTGLFPILEKKRDHISNLYDAEMPFMMRLTWDGIAIHGSEVSDEYATHGCVGLPEEFAELLFEEAAIGDEVLITNGWMTGVYAPRAGAAEIQA